MLAMASPGKDSVIWMQQKLIEDIRECIHELKKCSKVGHPVAEIDINRFCSKMELLFLHGLKEKTGRLANDYHTFLKECSKSNREMKASMALLAKHNETETKQSQGRAFLKFALVNHLLAELFQHCETNAKAVREYYHLEQSIFHNQNLCMELSDLLYDLNDVNFGPDVSRVAFALRRTNRERKEPFEEVDPYNERAGFLKSLQEKKSTAAACPSCEGGDGATESATQKETLGSPSVASMSSYHSCEDGRPEVDSADARRNEGPIIRRAKSNSRRNISRGREKSVEKNRMQEEEEEEESGIVEERLNAERLKRERDEYSTEVFRLLERVAHLEQEKAIQVNASQSLMQQVEHKDRLLDLMRLQSDQRSSSEMATLQREVEALAAFFESVRSACLPDLPRVIRARDPDTGRIDESALDTVRALIEAKVELAIGRPSREPEVQTLRTEVATTRQTLAAAEVEKNLLLEKWETAKSNSKAKISSLREQVESLEGELEKSRKSEEELRAALELAKEEGRAMADSIEDGLAEKRNIVRELKEDMEAMAGSFKRREILMEQMRRDFEKSTETLLREHSQEVAGYQSTIRKLESKISSDLTHEKKDQLEAKIESMEEKLLSSKEDLLVAQYEFKDKVNALNNRLESMEGENVSLRNQVSQLSKECRSERSTVKSLREKLEKDRKEHEAAARSLKESVARLVDDKKQLWLKYQDDKERWEKSGEKSCCSTRDGDRNSINSSMVCQSCTTAFSSCHSDSTDLSNFSDNASNTTHHSDLCGPGELGPKEESVVPLPSMLLLESNNADDVTKSNEIYNEPGVDNLLPPEVCVPHEVNRGSGGLSALARLTGGVKNAAVWATTTAVSSIVKTTGHVSGIFGKSPNSSRAETPFVYDDRFEIITPDEITESRLILPSDDEAIILEVMDMGSREVGEAIQLMGDVPTGKFLLVPINLRLDSSATSKGGHSLQWSFHSEPQGVTFGICYHGPCTHNDSNAPNQQQQQQQQGINDDSNDDDKDKNSEANTKSGSPLLASFMSAPSQLFNSISKSSSSSSAASSSSSSFKFQKSEFQLPLTKVRSHLGSIGGNLIPKAAGVYSFVFDNTKSSMVTKKIHLKVKLVPRSSVPLPTDC